MVIALADDDVTIAQQGRTRNVLYLRRDGKWTATTYWKPDGILAASRRLPKRPFVMACRALCGFDLKFPHPTCWTGCRIRRTWYGKLPETIEIDRIIQIAVIKNRRFAHIKDILLYRAGILTAIENLLCN
jgi:hypothetical protein